MTKEIFRLFDTWKKFWKKITDKNDVNRLSEVKKKKFRKESNDENEVNRLSDV